MGDLLASRTLGTERQLFSAGRSSSVDSNEFPLRLNSTRRSKDLKFKLKDILSQESYPNSTFLNGCFILVDSEKILKRNFNFDVPSLISKLKNIVHESSFSWDPAGLMNLMSKERRLEIAHSDATVSFESFVNYLNSNEALSDDNPCYVFETLVDGDHDDLISKFRVPYYFTDMNEKNSSGLLHTPGDTADLFSELSENGLRFGLHRWLLIGPAGSGSNLHQDPLFTSAWNTVTYGKKLWVLFPPKTPEHLIKSSLRIENEKQELTEKQPVEDPSASSPAKNALEDFSAGIAEGLNSSTASTASSDEPAIQQEPVDYCAAGWFAYILPQVEQAVAAGSWPQDCLPIKFVQFAGQTVHVPAGWWHAVLNLDTSTSVTQNYARPANYQQVAAALYDEVADQDSDSVEDVDNWRERVAVRWPHLPVAGRCVHCAELCGFRQNAFFAGRPLCAGCETSRSEYQEMSEQEIAEQFDIHMSLIPRDECPPHVVRRPTGSGSASSRHTVKRYLRSHIVELAAS